MKSQKVLMLVGLLGAALILSGCFQMDMTVRLGSNEQWDATVDMIFDRDLLEMSTGMGGEELDMSELETSLDDAVAEILNQYGDQGVTASWREMTGLEEDKIGYTMLISGQGYDLLNQVMFEGNARITPRQEGGRQVVDFSLDTMSGALGAGDFGELSGQDLSQMMGVMDITVTFALEGSEILQSNGTVSEDGRRVEWVNSSGPYTATIAPGGMEVPTWVWIAIGVVCCGFAALVAVAAIVIAIVLIRRRNKPKAV